MGQARHLGVLLGDSLVCVQHDKAYVGTLDSHGGPQDGKPFDRVVYLGFFPHARRIDEDILPLVVFKITVHRVPGGARHFGDDDPLLAEDAVHQRGFAHVGLADHRHADDVVLFRLSFVGRKVGKAGIQQVAGAVPVDGGDRDGVSQPQAVKLIDFRIDGACAVHLVDGQHHRAAGAQKDPRHLLVGDGESRSSVADKDNHGGVLNGNFRLFAHEG
ncbi:hypothetical protein SDC9_59354 [bioreactor metagenome]|uniref:Uncharacterized protein n=1 Tax=bioreactor metagenome TaxID=1076179 RepID=A0A644XA79_9ZZZZ